MLFIIYHQSWLTMEVQGDWRLANVVPIYKKGQNEDLGPFSLTLVARKVMELIILNVIIQHVQDNQGIRPSQGLGKGRPCLTNLISFHDQVTCLLNEGKAMDVSTWTSVKPFILSPTVFSLTSWQPTAWTGALLAGLKTG
ncbi:hypothetical protein DUI87_01122 [Hirundo rustica rustica]|uniref:Reverse transcriptase domain-containing protein n=1 Tax=Hirundo rustica rustica TaxID=333673 RepID=A0A3M0L5I3_HIRRU|nr:hypothetical protein DUI87_01122 [Hirundo rustica rustica]